MNTYIAILRGINVSGQKKIKMADLKQYVEEAGLEQVRTYIQSGNIVFTSSSNSAEAHKATIENVILKRYAFEVPTLIKTSSQLEYVLKKNPFLKNPANDVDRMYITFLANVPDADRARALEEYDFPPEEYVLDGDIIFGYSPLGYGKARMNNNFFEHKLKVIATTRNWKTVNVLFSMAAEIE